jgi:hypothetical protein
LPIQKGGRSESRTRHAFDLAPLADQASDFGNDHPEHADGRHISRQTAGRWMFAPSRKYPKGDAPYSPADEAPSGFDECATFNFICMPVHILARVTGGKT